MKYRFSTLLFNEMLKNLSDIPALIIVKLCYSDISTLPVWRWIMNMIYGIYIY